MVKQIEISDLEVLLDLVAFVEFEGLNINNENHLTWVKSKLDKLSYAGANFFGCYNEENNPVGFATILVEDRPKEISDGWTTCELMQIGVYDKYQNKGYGSELLEYVQNFAKNKKSYSMFVHTYAEDNQVICFYGKNGFIPVATVPDVYGPNLQGMLFMSKVLV